jgi:hypothetical protein
MKMVIFAESPTESPREISATVDAGSRRAGKAIHNLPVYAGLTQAPSSNFLSFPFHLRFCRPTAPEPEGG